MHRRTLRHVHARLRRTSLLVVVATAVALPALTAAPARAATAPLTVSSGSIDFGAVAVNTTQTQAVTAMVASGYVVGAPQAQQSGSPGGSSGNSISVGSNTCTNLADGGTCTITFAFTPDATGSAGYYADYLVPVCLASIGAANCSFQWDEGSVYVLVTGDGVNVFAADPTSLDFGDVPLNTTVARDVTFTVDAGYFFGGVRYAPNDIGIGVDFGTCGAFFVGPGTCTAKVSFTPTATGAVTADLYGEECPGSGGNCNPSTAGYDTAHVALAGNGVSALAASPAGIDFGDVPVNTPAHQGVTITLDAGYYFNGDVGVTGGGFYVGSCGYAVGPGTCRLDFTFEPTTTGAAGGTAAIVECPDTGGCSSSSPGIRLTIPLTGNGVSVLAASPATLDFGNVTVGTMARKTVTLTLDSGYYLAGAGGSNPAFGVGASSCSGTTCSIDVTFAPTSLGAASDTIAIHECLIGDTVCAASPLLGYTTTVSAEGTGVSPVADLGVGISAPSPARNKQPVTLTITVKNDGPNGATGVTLSNTLPSASGYDSYSTSQGTCTTPPIGSTGTMVCSLGDLASGATATITVTVTPTVKNNNLIQDTATVSQAAIDTDPVQADNTATVTVQVK